MALIHLLLKLLFINKYAYAINEYHYTDKENSKYNDIYYRIEKVVIKDIYFDRNVIQYMVTNINNEDWGDTTEYVYLFKCKASKELLKLCNL